MWWPISHRTGVLTDTDTQGECRVKMTQREEWCFSRVASKPPDAGARPGMDSPQEPLEGTGLAHTLILDIWRPDWETIHFWCLNHSVCGALSQQPQQPNPLTQSSWNPSARGGGRSAGVGAWGLRRPVDVIYVWAEAFRGGQGWASEHTQWFTRRQEEKWVLWLTTILGLNFSLGPSFETAGR